MINILFAGDFIPPAKLDVFSKDIIDLLSGADFSILNLEAPVTINKKSIKKIGNNFRVDPSKFTCIYNKFFKAVSLANNHIRDFGDEGVTDTLSFCRQNGIQFVGAGQNKIEASRPLKLRIQNRQITVFNYCEKEFNEASEGQAGANVFDLITAYQEILRERVYDNFIIVIFHGGIEYNYMPSRIITKQMRFLIDIGVDFILCHHSHRYSGIEIYRNKPIFYGLGNLLAPTKTKNYPDWYKGIIVQLKIDYNKIDFELHPTMMENDFQKVFLLSGEAKNDIIRHVDELSLTIKDENLFKEYWIKEFQELESRNKIYNIITSSNKFKYRLRKYLPNIYTSQFTEYQMLNLLNLIQCDSQREQVLEYLKNAYKFKS